MAPILVDQRGLVKIVFIAASTAVFIFVSGFLSGYQRAAVIYQPGSEIASLALPEISVGEPSDIEPHRPEVIAAGENIDVDQPEVPDKVTNDVYVHIGHTFISKQASNPESGKGASKVQVIASIDENPDKVAQNNRQNDGFRAVDDIENVEKNIDTGKEGVTSSTGSGLNNPATVKQVAAATSNVSDPDELKKIKYSIQVGMYGQQVNAENMVIKLQAQQFDAYVSEYLNKKNEVLYNVRVGYFVDKKTAVTALQEYKNKQNSDGYLVKFSPSSIVRITDVDAITTTNAIKKSDNNSPPAVISSEIALEKISQIEMSKASSNLADSQTSIITN